MNFQNHQALDSLIFYGKPEPKDRSNTSEIVYLDFESFIYYATQSLLMKTRLQIEIIRDKAVKYYIDGENIRTDQMNSSSFRPEVLTNLEQIKYLKWQATHPMNSKKHFKWTAKWKDEVLLEVGGFYNQNGQKQGFWKQPIKNYCSVAQVYELGEYMDGNKCGLWKYIYNNKKIGGGQYNKQGQKQGKWIELGDTFWIGQQVIYHGEYKNDIKVGIWDIQPSEEPKYEEFAGGSYLYEGQSQEISLKNGLWVELKDEFFFDGQRIKFNGEYKRGKKVGRWDSLYKVTHRFDIIGGGSYDDDEKRGTMDIKTGRWIELCENYGRLSGHIFVTHCGDYQSGKKMGRWDICFLGKGVGGGLYDENGFKMGNWIELTDEFNLYTKVTYQGDYKYGKKIGRWNTFYSEEGCKSVELIGGGLYNDNDKNGSLGVKFGKWIEQSQNYGQGTGSSLVTYGGEYKNGKKIGHWEILFRNFIFCKDEQIGGGLYDDNDGSAEIKIGKWVEISENFGQGQKFTQSGEYQSGKRVGEWIYTNLQNKQTWEMKYNYY